MKVITGFFMAWGCFSAIPCPYKKWDESARNLMLAALPFIGLMHGLIWWAAAWLLTMYFDTPRLLAAALLALLLPALSGFIHVDGYMDCCDAIFSRRDLAERQRILKDSSVGAFAAIALAALLMLQTAAMYEILVLPEYFPILALVPMLTRLMSAEAVWKFPPLATSQYSRLAEESSRKSYRLPERCMEITTLIAVVIFYVLFSFEGIFTIWTSFDMILVAAILAHFIACYGARKNLGGMSGDISGFAITIGEAAAIIVAAII